MTQNTQSFSSWFNTIKADDIDGGLAADFDGSLSGLGVELGSNTYNMSEALLALPVFKTENFEQGGQEAGAGEGVVPAGATVVHIASPSWPQSRFQYVLSAATSPATKVNEETLTYLNQGQPYEVKLKRLGDLNEVRGKYVRSIIRVIFHERRLQYMEREQLESWERTRPGESILDLDIPLSYGILDVKQCRTNAVEFLWDPAKNAGIYIKVNCISTEFTAKKHGGEKGVPFRIQVESYLSDTVSSYKLMNCASCQVKVFKPKGADRKHKTDREKLEKRQPSEREVYQPSYECTVLTEIALEQAQNYLEQLLKHQAEEQAQQQKKIIPPVATQPQPPMTVAVATKHQRHHSGGKPVAAKGQSKASPPQSPLITNIGSLNLSSPPSTSAPPRSSAGGGKDVRNFGCISEDSKTSMSSDSTFSMGSSTPIKSPQGPKRKEKAIRKVSSTPALPTPDKTIEPLLAEATAQEVTQWLHHNRFSHYVKVFQNFAGADLLRLSRDDLIQICGLADGIRLNNALQAKTVRPKLTLYLCQNRTIVIAKDTTPSPGTSPTSLSALTSSSHRPPTSQPSHPSTSPPNAAHPLISPSHFTAGPPSTGMKTKRQYGDSLEHDEDDVIYTKKQRTRHLSLAKKGVYHALYLEHLTLEDLSEKIGAMFNVQPHQLRELYVQGPSGIQVLVTDEVVANFTNESRYSIEAFQADEDSPSTEYIVHLRSSGSF